MGSPVAAAAGDASCAATGAASSMAATSGAARPSAIARRMTPRRSYCPASVCTTISETGETCEIDPGSIPFFIRRTPLLASTRLDHSTLLRASPEPSATGKEPVGDNLHCGSFHIVPSRATECEISPGKGPRVPPEFHPRAVLAAADHCSGPGIGDRFVDLGCHLRCYGNVLAGPFLLRRAPA